MISHFTAGDFAATEICFYRSLLMLQHMKACGNPRLTVRLTIRAGSGVSDLRQKAVAAQPQFRIARHQATRTTYSQAAESRGRGARLKRQAAG